MALTMCCGENNGIPENACSASEKPKGKAFLEELEELGFKLDFVSFTEVLYGTYEYLTINDGKTELRFKIRGYLPVTFYSSGTYMLKNIE